MRWRALPNDRIPVRMTIQKPSRELSEPARDLAMAYEAPFFRKCSRRGTSRHDSRGRPLCHIGPVRRKCVHGLQMGAARQPDQHPTTFGAKLLVACAALRAYSNGLTARSINAVSHGPLLHDACTPIGGVHHFSFALQ